MALSNTERSRLAREKKKLAGPALEERATELRLPVEKPVARKVVSDVALEALRHEVEIERGLRKAQEVRLAQVEDELAVWVKRFGAPGLVAQKPLDPITALRRELDAVTTRAVLPPGTDVTLQPPPTIRLVPGYNPMLSVPEDPEDFTTA